MHHVLRTAGSTSPWLRLGCMSSGLEMDETKMDLSSRWGKGKGGRLKVETFFCRDDHGEDAWSVAGEDWRVGLNVNFQSGLMGDDGTV